MKESGNAYGFLIAIVNPDYVTNRIDLVSALSLLQGRHIRRTERRNMLRDLGRLLVELNVLEHIRWSTLAVHLGLRWLLE